MAALLPRLASPSHVVPLSVQIRFHFVSFPLTALTGQHHATCKDRTWNAFHHDDAFPIGNREAKIHAEANYAE